MGTICDPIKPHSVTVKISKITNFLEFPEFLLIFDEISSFSPKFGQNFNTIFPAKTQPHPAPFSFSSIISSITYNLYVIFEALFYVKIVRMYENVRKNKMQNTQIIASFFDLRQFYGTYEKLKPYPKSPSVICIRDQLWKKSRKIHVWPFSEISRRNLPYL